MSAIFTPERGSRYEREKTGNNAGNRRGNKRGDQEKGGEVGCGQQFPIVPKELTELDAEEKGRWLGSVPEPEENDKEKQGR